MSFYLKQNLGLIFLQNAGINSIQASWNTPSQLNGVLKSYLLYATAVSTGSAEPPSTANGAPGEPVYNSTVLITYTTIEGLLAGTIYNISLGVRNFKIILMNKWIGGFCDRKFDFLCVITRVCKRKTAIDSLNHVKYFNFKSTKKTNAFCSIPFHRVSIMKMHHSIKALFINALNKS